MSTPNVPSVTDEQLATRAEQTLKAQRTKLLLRAALAVVGLVLIVGAVNVGTHGAFLTTGNIINVLRQITYNAILAVGQTFVIITGGIDLSVGSLVSLSGVLMATFANSMHLSGVTLVVATLIVGILAGGFAGYINALPVVRMGLPPFITTLAMMLVARGLAYRIADGQPIPLASEAFNSTGTGFAFAGVPNAVLWLAVIVVGFAILLSRTRFGRYVYAIGGNEEAARLAGIQVAHVKTLVYVISGACAAVAGLLLMARFGSGSPQTGLGYELQAIAAVVVGGTSLTGGRGSIWGTFVGALLIGILNNVMNLLNIESYTQEIVLGAVILAAVMLDAARKRWFA
jgi:ribose/xylose/arabinose/galactoside ABC-type transport system permease subunit